MDVFSCAVCGDPDEGRRKGIAAIHHASQPRRRPVWGPYVVLTD